MNYEDVIRCIFRNYKTLPSKKIYGCSRKCNNRKAENVKTTSKKCKNFLFDVSFVPLITLIQIGDNYL